MPNWCSTYCKVTGPEDDIERFKAACSIREPKDDENNGLALSGRVPTSIYHCNENGEHMLYLETAWEPPIEVFLPA